MRYEKRRARMMRSTNKAMRGANPLNNEESTTNDVRSCARDAATVQKEANPEIVTTRALITRPLPPYV
jgi:hypothetical protein